MSSIVKAQEARKNKILDTNVRVNGGVIISRRELILNRVELGAYITVINGERVLMSPDGAFLDALNITKTGLDYAATLLVK